MSQQLVQNIVILIVTGSAFSLFTLSIGYLFERERYGWAAGASLFLMQGIETLLLAAESAGLWHTYPHLLYINQPFEFLWAPLVYWYLKTKVERSGGMDTYFILLWVPPAAAFAAYMPFFLQSAALKLANPGFENLPPLLGAVCRVLMVLPMPLLGVTELLYLVRVYRLLGKKGPEYVEKAGHFKPFAMLWVVIFVCSYIIYYVHEGVGFLVFLLFINANIILVYFLEGRSRLFFSLMRMELSEAKYRRSQLKGIDTPQTIARIREIVETEELYRDSELTLTALASRLSMTPHQLSELFNRGMGCSFKTYLNDCRIKAAVKMLGAEQDVNILNIAYACGYNSKSVFYTAFTRQTGLSPLVYREKNLNKKAK